MVGLVKSKAKIKSMHEMLKEKTKKVLKEEEIEAKKFIRRMRKEAAERQAFKEQYLEKVALKEAEKKMAEMEAKEKADKDKIEEVKYRGEKLNK